MSARCDVLSSWHLLTGMAWRHVFHSIITTPPSSYIIPNAIASTEDAGFIKLTLPTGIDTERRETFEAILWGLTSFSTTSSRAEPGEAPPSYADPAMRSKLVIVNEKGAVVGTLANNMTVSEDPLLSKEGQGPSHEKEPVVIEPSASASSPFDFSARPVSAWQGTPNPTGSSIITAADWVSNGIIVGADMISRSVEWGAGKYITSRKATDKPMEFSPAAKTRADKANLYTGKVVVVSSKAARAVGDAAAAVGGRLGKGLGIQSKEGEEPKGLKGLVNKSLVAFNTVLDAAEQGGKSLLASGSQSTTQVVNHAYGGEAADISRKIGGSVQHCALVYIDARGVSRRAILKGVGKGALRAKISDGREVILSSENQQSSAQSEGTIASGLGTGSTGGTEKTLAGKR